MSDQKGDDCSHPGYLAGMCIRCGADKPADQETADSLLPFRYVAGGLEFSREEAQKLSAQTTALTESRKKLHLVLDLDHTLLHSAPIEMLHICPYLLEWLKTEQTFETNRTLFDVPRCRSLTKLRPGVFEFLRGLSPLYEMHIYTMSEEQYASEMAKLLDPDGKLFQRRIIAREHSADPYSKSLDVVISSERSTLIVDDTSHVWKKHSGNLVSASKYCFFPSEASDVSWTDLRADECGSTGELSRIRRLLERVHGSYFSGSEDQSGRDVRLVMRNLVKRKRVRS